MKKQTPKKSVILSGKPKKGTITLTQRKTIKAPGSARNRIIV